MPKPSRKPGSDLFGLPDLVTKDAQKVFRANRMFFLAIRLLKKCLKRGISAYLENPASSLVWLTPQILRLLQDPRVQLVTTDFCQFGTHWKNSTSLLLINCHPANFARCRPKGLLSHWTSSFATDWNLWKGFYHTASTNLPETFSRQLVLTFKHPVPPNP